MTGRSSQAGLAAVRAGARLQQQLDTMNAALEDDRGPVRLRTARRPARLVRGHAGPVTRRVARFLVLALLGLWPAAAVIAADLLREALR